MIRHKTNPDIYYDLLLRFKKVFAKGGINRQKYTYPALCFSMIRLTAFIAYPPDVPEEAKQEEEALEEGEEPEPAPTVQVAQPKIIKNLAEMINAL